MEKGVRTAIITILIVAFSIFLSGAQGCQSSGTTTTSTGYIGGTDGLSMAFLNTEPPERVLDNNNELFYVSIELENLGEYDIKEEEVLTTLAGVNKDAFQIKDLTKINKNPIEGKKKEGGNVLKGEKGEITYEAKYKEDLSADTPFTIGANVCYRYQTKSIVNLCLKKDVTERTTVEESCLITESKSISNWGSPVQVTAISEDTAGTNRAKVTFTIINKNKGEVFEQTAFSASKECSKTNEEKDKENKVNVKIKSAEKNLVFECAKLEGKDEGIVRLVDGLTTVTCHISTADLQNTAFESPIEITLDYMYKDSISKNIVVENAD